jgi:hypothetical protein
VEHEGERYKHRTSSVGGIGSSSDLVYQDAQAARLLAEVEFNERLAQSQARYNLELQALKDQLAETEAQRDSLQREVRGNRGFLLLLFIFFLNSL